MAGCCRDISTLYLYVFNFIVLVFGLLILSVGAYLTATLDKDFKEVGLGNPIIASLVFGIGLTIFGLIGILGTCWDNKCLIFTYIIGVFVLGVCVLASGIVLLVLAGKFENVQDGQVDNAVEERILDFELAMFNECCAQQPLVPDVQECNDVINIFLCFSDKERFDEFSALFDEDTCKLLEDNLELNGKPLIGPVTELNGGCGNGVVSIFVNNINQYIEDNLQLLGAANVVAGCVLLLLLVAACVVLWSKEEERKKQQQQGKVGCF